MMGWGGVGCSPGGGLHRPDPMPVLPEQRTTDGGLKPGNLYSHSSHPEVLGTRTSIYKFEGHNSVYNSIPRPKASLPAVGENGGNCSRGHQTTGKEMEPEGLGRPGPQPFAPCLAMPALLLWGHGLGRGTLLSARQFYCLAPGLCCSALTPGTASATFWVDGLMSSPLLPTQCTMRWTPPSSFPAILSCFGYSQSCRASLLLAPLPRAALLFPILLWVVLGLLLYLQSLVHLGGQVCPAKTKG